MFNESNLRKCQLNAIEQIPRIQKVALHLDMGAGKTIAVLTVISKLLDEFSISKALIIAPLQVANNVWHNEIQKWEHVKHLTWSIVTGTHKKRLDALNKDVNIYIINRENVCWLHQQKFTQKFDFIVLDESSSFKNPSSERFKSLKIFKCDYLVELTGTPSPNGLLDIWSQYYLLDQGKSLGHAMYVYKERFFYPDYHGYKWTPRDPKQIYKAIEHLTISMKDDDYIELPERIDLITPVIITKYDKYKELEKEFILQLENKEIAVSSMPVLVNKLLQFCNGAIYDENKHIIELHQAKLDALEGIIEDNPNENILVAFNFKSDLKRLKNRFKHAYTMKEKENTVEKWNKGEIKLLLCHPASAGKGLNLQYGGHIIVWFGLTWNLEDYLQFNKRLHRPGQLKPVIINHIVAQNCIDEKVLKVLNQKNLTQQSLLNAFIDQT